MKKFIFYVFLLLVIQITAQNRIVVNPGFNTGSNLPSSGWGNVESQLSPNPGIDGWYTTHPAYGGYSSPIEVWTDGFLGTPAQEGSHFVELNASTPSRLYQIVYLVNGENIDWEYYHRNRPGGLATQTIKYSVYSQDGSTELYVIDSYNNTITTTWTHRQGTFNVGLSTGIYQIGFESTAGTSYGNLLDNVTIDLDPLVEFTNSTAETTESESSTPYLEINGKVAHASSVTIRINSSSASNPSDYTYSSLTINVPLGEYGIADSIAIPFSIVDDNNVEGDETIEIEIVSVTGDLLQQDADGTLGNENICIYKIVDDDFLPVELTMFKVKKYGTVSAKLFWETASEINSDYFIVERLTDNNDWKQIGKIKAAGNTNIIQEYTLIDRLPMVGVNIYRLKEVDYDGSTNYSKEISYTLPVLNTLKIYPNPVINGNINIETKSTSPIFIYDSNGRMLRSEKPINQDHRYLINLSKLGPGIYYLRQDDLQYKFIVPDY